MKILLFNKGKLLIISFLLAIGISGIAQSGAVFMGMNIGGYTTGLGNLEARVYEFNKTYPESDLKNPGMLSGLNMGFRFGGESVVFELAGSWKSSRSNTVSYQKDNESYKIKLKTKVSTINMGVLFDISGSQSLYFGTSMDLGLTKIMKKNALESSYSKADWQSVLGEDKSSPFMGASLSLLYVIPFFEFRAYYQIPWFSSNYSGDNFVLHGNYGISICFRYGSKEANL